MKIVRGDVIDLALSGRFDLIVHGMNCMNTMSSGIARQIRDRLPEAAEADLVTRPGDKSKLGAFSWAHVVRGPVSFVVVNAYTQFDWKGTGVKVDYGALTRAFAAIAAEWSGLRIGYPMLGAGLAGGDWMRISKIIDSALAGQDHTLVVRHTDADSNLTRS